MGFMECKKRLADSGDCDLAVCCSKDCGDHANCRDR